MRWVRLSNQRRGTAVDDKLLELFIPFVPTEGPLSHTHRRESTSGWLCHGKDLKRRRQDYSVFEMAITTDPTDLSLNPRDGTRHRDTSLSSSRNCGHRAAGSPAYLWSVHNTAGRRFGASHAGPHVSPMPIVRTVRQCAKSYPRSLPCPRRGRGD